MSELFYKYLTEAEKPSTKQKYGLKRHDEPEAVGLDDALVDRVMNQYGELLQGLQYEFNGMHDVYRSNVVEAIQT